MNKAVAAVTRTFIRRGGNRCWPWGRAVLLSSAVLLQVRSSSAQGDPPAAHAATAPRATVAPKAASTPTTITASKTVVTNPGSLAAADAAETLVIRSPSKEKVAPSHAEVAAPASTKIERMGPTESVLTLERAPVQAFVLKADQTTEAVDLSEGAVKLSPKEIFLSKSLEAPRQLPQSHSGGTPALALPYEMHFLDESGQARDCELVADTGGGFHVGKDGRLFVAELFVALKDKGNWSSSYQLPKQGFQILISAAVDEVAPQVLTLQRTNAWEKIALGSDAPSDEVPVRIRPAVDPSGLELKVPVTRPRLSLTLNPSEVQGFGLDTAKLLVSVEGLPNPAGRAITLNASAGRLSVTRVTLDGEGTAEAVLRSEGLGKLEIVAQGAGTTVARTDGRFLWPREFLLSALLGSLAGALISVLRKRSLQSLLGIHSLKEIAVGMLTGVFVAVAYAAGMNVFSIELPTFGGEALVFTAAAMGALGLAVRLFPSSPPPAGETETAPAKG